MKPKTFADLYKDAEAHEDYWIAGCVQEFTEEIFRLMEQGGITRSELARRLGTSPAYVTKILRGDANFTLATMVRLTRALGAELRLQLTPVANGRPGSPQPRHSSFSEARRPCVPADESCWNTETCGQAESTTTAPAAKDLLAELCGKRCRFVFVGICG